MQFEEACKQATTTIQSTISMIEGMLEELENFDNLAESAIWGVIQNRLIHLKDEYLLGMREIEEAEAEEDGIDDLTSKIQEAIIAQLLTIKGEENKAIHVDVRVTPATLH